MDELCVPDTITITELGELSGVERAGTVVTIHYRIGEPTPPAARYIALRMGVGGLSGRSGGFEPGAEGAAVVLAAATSPSSAPMAAIHRSIP